MSLHTLPEDEWIGAKMHDPDLVTWLKFFDRNFDDDKYFLEVEHDEDGSYVRPFRTLTSTYILVVRPANFVYICGLPGILRRGESIISRRFLTNETHDIDAIFEKYKAMDKVKFSVIADEFDR